ncbi:trafficking protein particle complex subunit 2-like protein isoform X2 [Schistocerca piceifrons]|uniref:trafficking protein particle complex subunit 2-like protein n=1 Tax=Schistocerca cancellata TaxID=274614 RepID=UPI001F5ECC1B|nr:trafficking protein particle complex subunit 2-like protein isoform X2 [Schistocerca piceifrons]XP_049763980.1 trafficking protein particle complex subunit 2-like protein [Schistocerca cancellata]XP_049790403.1 trafficking protein particle complex subunit 2-like protein [Schistocerca nitens]XP_049834258.1 trafficking protein particle complex subunit 2-like protein isoform X2 [Schistocerca gregaria]
MAVCVAIIGKDNSPKYISCLNPELELQFHYKVHTSLDVVEEKLTSVGKTTADVRELYLGLLYSTEEHKIFGYVTNTKIKFIIVVESSNTLLRDNEVRTMFRKLHSLYTDVVCNPFYIPGDVITSKNFDTTVRNMMTGNA